MGLYDTFGKVQLKAGDCVLDHYAVGDKVQGIKDGVYIGLEGVVVILKGKLIAEFPYAKDKWGDPIKRCL
jgi:hypothetical protein